MKRYNRRNLKVWGLKAKTWATLLILAELIIIISLVGLYAKSTIKVRQAEAVYDHLSVNKPEVIMENPTSEQEQIISYIKQVFGAHSSKAFRVLECENKSLNPNAVHDNEYWGQGLGKDVGIFQVNTYWQGVNARFLKNYKVNVDIAWQIYKDSGYNFHLWTCGRKIGV